MKPLPETFRQDGFDFTMLRREGRVAMFRKAKSERNTGFEVVIVQWRPEHEWQGKIYPASEAMPGNELWGKQGWSQVTREAADARFRELIAR